jgi:hypothetical protein
VGLQRRRSDQLADRGQRGHGISIATAGTNVHGIFVTGGTGGVSDGARFVAGTGGVDIRGNITGNIAGTLTTVTTLSNLPAVPTDWLTAAGVKADAVTKIQSGLALASGVVLTSAGLDNISIADPGNASSLTTFPKLLVALCRRMFWKKSDLNATKLNMYADNGTTVNMHMPVSDDGTTQTQGAAVDGP